VTKPGNPSFPDSLLPLSEDILKINFSAGDEIGMVFFDY
jgi:hypothetical protein